MYIFQALVAMKLYKSLTHEAEQNDLEIDVTQKLKSFSRFVFCANKGKSHRFYYLSYLNVGREYILCHNR